MADLTRIDNCILPRSRGGRHGNLRTTFSSPFFIILTLMSLGISQYALGRYYVNCLNPGPVNLWQYQDLTEKHNHVGCINSRPLPPPILLYRMTLAGDGRGHLESDQVRFNKHLCKISASNIVFLVKTLDWLDYQW